MSRVLLKTEFPPPSEPRGEGISRARAHLFAEASQALATHEVKHDESEPMGQVLARMDEVLPPPEHYRWLVTPNEHLAGYAPIEYVDADDLDPIRELLDEMPPVESGR